MRTARRTTVAAAAVLALALTGGITSSAGAAAPAAASSLTASVDQVSLDPVWVTKGGYATVRITNNGPSAVLVPYGNVDPGGSPRTDWNLNGYLCSGELLAAGASCVLNLTYNPAAPWTGTVSVEIAVGPTGLTTLRWPVVAKVDDLPPVMHVPPIPAFTRPFLPFAVAAGYADEGTGDATEDVRVRLAGTGAADLGPWVYPRAWQGGRWGEGGGWLAYGLGIGSLVPGVTECSSYRARDLVGNVSEWTTPRCTSAMWDDRRALASVRGWTRGTGDDRYYEFGTWTRATTRGATLAGPVVTTRRIAVLGTTCPTCGAVDVYVGTTRLGALSLKGAMKHRALLMLPARATAVRGQIRLVVRTSGQPVIVDAIGTRIN